MKKSKPQSDIILLIIVLIVFGWLHSKIGGISILILTILIISIWVVVRMNKHKKPQKRVANIVNKDSLNNKKKENLDLDLDYTKTTWRDLGVPIDEFEPQEDFLRKAASAKHKAKEAVKLKDFDKAWGLYNDQKLFYMQHAKRGGFTKQQYLALDSQVHEDLADILRMEKRHIPAFIDILYWVIANNHHPTKRHQQKLTAYFNRCKFKKTTKAC